MCQYICPLCDQIVDDPKHIFDVHKEFWDARYPTETIPQGVEEFNKRFGLIGLSIREYKNENRAENTIKPDSQRGVRP